MNYWKVLGGAAGGVAAGVGLVAALPVAGAIGTVTIAGAAIAGTLGATTGGLAGVGGEKFVELEKEAAYKKGKREATASHQKKVEKLVTALGEADNKINDFKSYHQLLIALFAVGMATANADGEIIEEELIDLNEFTAGIAHTNLPNHVKETILKLKDNPPNFMTAMEHVNKLPEIDTILFESVIEVISDSDNKITEEEVALLSAFRQAKASPPPLPS